MSAITLTSRKIHRTNRKNHKHGQEHIEKRIGHLNPPEFIPVDAL
jgi:hypothetical protein